mmetsp:Transcript_65885/g.157504  ORF Transcript_65885/g.157504 Transcript_65885/m.157504 type:complete len:861 (+) Transcript_65885:70-2652(+)
MPDVAVQRRPGLHRSMTEPSVADMKGPNIVAALSHRMTSIMAGANTAINEAMEVLKSLDEDEVDGKVGEEDASDAATRDDAPSPPQQPLEDQDELLPYGADLSLEQWCLVHPLPRSPDSFEEADADPLPEEVQQFQEKPIEGGALPSPGACFASASPGLPSSPLTPPSPVPPQMWQLLSEVSGKVSGKVSQVSDTVMGRLEEFDAWAEATVGGGSLGSAAPSEPAPRRSNTSMSEAVRDTRQSEAKVRTHSLAECSKLPTAQEESAEAWLNNLTAALWPQVSNYLAQVLRSVIEPVLRDALPSFQLRFTTLKLGPELPAWGPPSLRTYGGGLRIDTSVRWEAEVDVAMSGLPADVGINRASLDGDFSLILRPFLPRPPFLGALEAFFANPPAVRLSFTGLGHVARLPGLSGAVRRAVDSGLARVCVLPRRLCVPLEAPTPLSLARMRCPAPVGLLQLTLVQAEGLAQGSLQERIAGPTAPSVRISLGAGRWTSSQASPGLVPDSGDPLWIWPHASSTTASRQHTFTVDCRSQMVTMEVLGSRGSLLARACCSVASFPWPQSQAVSSESGGHGIVRIPCQPRGILLLDASWLVASQGPVNSAKERLPQADTADSTQDAEGTSGPPLVLLSAEVLEARIPPYVGREALSSVRVRVQVAMPLNCGRGQVLQTGQGRAPWASSSSNHLGPRDDLLLSTMQRMWAKGMQPETIAEVLDLQTELVESYCQTALEEDSLEEREAWLRKLRKAHAKHAALSSPQFAEVLYFTAPAGVGVTFELIDSNGEVRFRSGLVKPGTSGPFELSPIGAGFGARGRPVAAAKVYGTLHQHELQEAHPRCYSDPMKKISIDVDATQRGHTIPRPAA